MKVRTVQEIFVTAGMFSAGTVYGQLIRADIVGRILVAILCYVIAYMYPYIYDWVKK